MEDSQQQVKKNFFRFNKNLIYMVLTILIFVGIIVGWAVREASPKPTDPKIDKLAMCLTEKGVAMYGAYWCSHCQNQKKIFGESFKYVKYIECTQEIKNCEEKNIEGYPTWIFKDGSRLSGEQPLLVLAQKVSCEYSP